MEPDEMEVIRDDQIDGHIAECIAVLKVLHDKNSDHYDRIKASFLRDMERLLELGRISADEYNEVTNEDNFSF